MKAVKRWEPPPNTKKRRKKGAGMLSRHVARGPTGEPIPYAFDEKKRPLWKYTIRIKLDDGKKKCRNIAALDDDDARDKAALAIADLRKDAEAATTAAKQAAKATETRTGNDLCDHFLAVRAAKNSATRDGTVAGYRREFERFIRPHFGALRVAEVTPEDVDRWAAKHNAEGSARTRQKRVILLASLFKLAVMDGWRGTSPVLQRHRVRVLKKGTHVGKLVGDQRVARVLGAAELAAIVDKLNECDPALRLLIALTAEMGFRVREAIHIRVEDVEFHDDGSAFIRVASGFPCGCRDCRLNGNTRLTKSGKPRLVPLPEERQDAVRKHLASLRARFGERGWCFPVWWKATRQQRSRPGDLRSAYTVSGTFAAAAKAAGITGVVFHDLRATAKTHLLMAGANPTAVDVAFGHQLPGMSSVYVTLESQPVLLYAGVYPTWRPQLKVVNEAKTA